MVIDVKVWWAFKLKIELDYRV